MRTSIFFNCSKFSSEGAFHKKSGNFCFRHFCHYYYYYYLACLLNIICALLYSSSRKAYLQISNSFDGIVLLFFICEQQNIQRVSAIKYKSFKIFIRSYSVLVCVTTLATLYRLLWMELFSLARS